MNSDIAGALVLIAVGLATVFGVWLGVTYARNCHTCLACGKGLVETCGEFCGPCEAASNAPLTAEERARGVQVLEEHLARWRGEA